MLTIKLTNRTFTFFIGNSRYCADDYDCADGKECNRNNKCVNTTTHRCGTNVHVVVVRTNEDAVNKCVRKLSRDSSLTRSLDKNLRTREMDDYEVIGVGNCSTGTLKNKMSRLVSRPRRRSTNQDVKTIVAVVGEGDLSWQCKRALRKLPHQLDRHLTCRQIRRMGDDQTEADDYVVIKVKSENQCNARNLENKVRGAADLN